MCFGFGIDFVRIWYRQSSGRGDVEIVANEEEMIYEIRMRSLESLTLTFNFQTCVSPDDTVIQYSTLPGI
jgi:hypothetical protein